MTEGADAAQQTAAQQVAEPPHGLRLAISWLVLSAICDPLYYFLAGPHMPPGAMSSAAANQQHDLNILAVIAIPVVIGVLLYFGYALRYWRAKDDDETDGPPIHGNTRIQLTWISATAAIVLFLAVFGSVELGTQAGAGAGEGPQEVKNKIKIKKKKS